MTFKQLKELLQMFFACFYSECMCGNKRSEAKKKHKHADKDKHTDNANGKGKDKAK